MGFSFYEVLLCCTIGSFDGKYPSSWEANVRRYIVSIALATFFLAATAIAAPTGKWVEVRSPNFVVVSNASEGQARKIDAQFEQIRSFFRESLGYAMANPSPVITVLAVKDEDSLRELLPEYWAQKGHAHPAGIFLGRYYQFQVAVNLNAHGDNPYEALYHEYYHSVTVPYVRGLPTWVAEGLADFWGNSVIRDKTAEVGMINPAFIAELRSRPLIPLSLLFKADHNSSYYNEQDKASIFYAESWALVHYLMLGDERAHSPAFSTYLKAIDQGASQDEAASKAFGDLQALQEKLEEYIGHSTFPAIQVPAPAKAQEGSIRARALSPAEVDAYAGGFLLLHNQFQAAEPLLNEATELDPKLALAQRNLSLLHYFRNEHADALTSISAALALDPQDSLAHYLRAEWSFDDGSHNAPQSEADLRQSLQSKPDFGPANALLAVYLAADDEKLPEALDFARKAVSIEAANPGFQLTLAEILVRLRRFDEAEALVRRVRSASPDDRIRSQADQMLTYITSASDNARASQSQDDVTASVSALTSAWQGDQTFPRPDERSTGKSSDNNEPSGNSDWPVLKRRSETTGVTKTDGPVRNPSCSYCPPPRYTPQARQAQFEGIVILQVTIQPNGRAADIKVVRSAPYGLDDTAVKAVQGWRFKPALRGDNEPIATVTRIEVTFRLLQ